MPEYSLIGKRIPRVDGVEKATGRLKYMTDLMFPGMLDGKVLRAKYPHALIKTIDITEAKQVEGIHCILTAKDIPGFNGFGIDTPDQPVLCDSKVRYLGDPVALVVGESEEQLAKAMALIKVDYEPLPVIDTPEKAMEPDAVKIHENGNIFRHIKGEVGDVEQGFAEADLIVENEYSTVRQEHAFIETEGGIGVPNQDGGVTVYHPSQYCYRDRMQLSKILNLPDEKIVIVSSPVGGAFGGKDDIIYQALLALAALKTRRPVKIHSEREESFLIGITRQPFRIKMRTAARKDGKLLAQDVHVVCDTGAYASLGGAITGFALENCCGCYYIPNVRLEGYTVYTNNQITGEFRGFGNNQMHFALESQMDIISRRLGIDPIELRKINCIKPGQRHSLGHALHSGIGALRTLEAAEQSEFWKERDAFKHQPGLPWLKRGVGIALCLQGVGLGKGLPDSSSAAVEITEDGLFTVATSNAELGQGSMTTLAIIAAEALGVGLDKIQMIMGDTSLCPDSGTATASRDTYITGNAVKQAAEELKKRITETAAEILNTDSAELHFNECNILAKSGQKLTLNHVAGELRNKGLARVTCTVSIPETDKNGVEGLTSHYVQGYLAQVVGVEVNTLTGKTDVLFAEAFADAGKVINRLGFEGQVEGGIVMGMGYALMENFKARQGELLTNNLQTYLIPVAADIHEIRTTPVEVLEETGPFGAKGLGEIPTVAITPAIINAIEDAVGVRVFDLPADPEKVYRLLQNLPTGTV